MTNSTVTAGGASARRTVGSGTRGVTGVVYGPLTGLAHRAGESFLGGRTTLANTALPKAHPGELGEVTPFSVCWSSIMRCNRACPHCLDDKSVPELGCDERAEVAARIGSAGVLSVGVFNIRTAIAGFIVVPGDGQVWRNTPDTTAIAVLSPPTGPVSLTVTDQDGSA